MTKSTLTSSKSKTTDIHRPETVVAARYPSAIGVDVHATLLVCAYQDGTQPNSIKTEHMNFGTKHSEIVAFARWCKERNPSIIVMESTGVLWRSAYEALEKVGFTAKQLALVNARDVKAIIGRKTIAKMLSDWLKSLVWAISKNHLSHRKNFAKCVNWLDVIKEFHRKLPLKPMSTTNY